MFPSSGDERETRTVLGHLEEANHNCGTLAISKEPNKVGVSLPLSEDGNRSCFRKVVSYTYLEFLAMDKVQRPSDSERSMISFTRALV
jgi:hypothetical protein